mmetsp:Transcript_12102/g.35802  ORF Transcript_12102/g.35802 Transcript_12102/m.35802 type:complete len:178 (-) Transcript_12102:192-725(-)
MSDVPQAARRHAGRAPSLPSMTHPAIQDLFDAGRRASTPGERPYWDDRNESMYTAEAVSARERLRANPGLVDAVRRFAHNVYGIGPEGSVSREEYTRVHSAMVRILMGEDVADGDVARIVAEDWESDSGGKERMDTEQLFDGLFELADLWCPSVSPAEYLSFIDTLTVKIMAGEGQS